MFFIDVVINIDLNRAQTPLICAGNGAEKIIMLMKNLGSPIRLLPNSKPGDAASLKLLCTIFMKGLSALAVECIVAAKCLGVKELLYDSLSDFNNTPLNNFLDMLLWNHVQHACRQKNEISEAAKQLQSANLPTQLLPAIEALFSTTCEKIASNPIQMKSPTTEEVLAWLIETRSQRNGSSNEL